MFHNEPMNNESSSSNEDVSDISFDGSESSVEFNNDGYINDPEYTEEEMKAMNFRDSDSGSTSGEEAEQDSSRLDNLHWCTCLHCTVMPTLVESNCCKEYSELLRDKLDGVNCIQSTPAISNIALSRTKLSVPLASIQAE